MAGTENAIPEEWRAEVEKWRQAPRQRPDHIPSPGPGQESVWDYPRPPAVERAGRRVRVEVGGIVLADSDRARRVLETASPPVYYLHPADVQMKFLERDNRRPTLCEWKGVAQYWSVRAGKHLVARAAWSYPRPFPGYEEIRDYLAFFPGKLTCYVGDERVTPQPGRYYGGWITAEILGPFKGEPGTEGW